MRILALDIGDRRIGVAISDPLGITAQRLTVLERQAPTWDADAVAALAAEHGVVSIVVGLPLTMQGSVGEQATKVMQFVELIKQRVGCPIELFDERMTTAQSEKALLETDTPRKRRKQLIDQLAAQLILQAYLDGKRA